MTESMIEVKGNNEDNHLKKRSDLHLARKIWHMSGVSMIAGLYSYMPEKYALLALVIAWVLFVPMDFIRLRVPAFNDVLVHFFKPIMREYELKGLAGTSYLLTGVTLVAALFPREIVTLTLLFLAFADPIASFFGIKFGKDKILGNKSLQGTLAAFVVCGTLTYGYLSYKGLMLDRIFMMTLLGGLIGALAELIPIWDLDDNLSLPVVSATALYFLFWIFGGLTTFTAI